VLYCLVGVFGAAVAGLLAALPRELVIALAGLALLGTIVVAGAVTLFVQQWRPRRDDPLSKP
jgi:benzoate membrane transport protein